MEHSSKPANNWFASLKLNCAALALAMLLINCVRGEDINHLLEKLNTRVGFAPEPSEVASCLQHEYFSRCFAYCDRHCPFKTHDGRILRKPARMCLRICKAGCLCQPGYVRDKYSGHCVQRTTCPYHWDERKTQRIATNDTRLNDLFARQEAREKEIYGQIAQQTDSSVANRIINIFAFFTNLVFAK